MTTPLRSALWYRVAALKPNLRPHARLHRHQYRRQVWHLLQDSSSGRVHRFTPSARLVIGLMDGHRNVEQIWTIANRRLGENAPTQDEMIQLLGQLHAADLLQSDVTPDVAELFARGERETRARYRRSFGNPMALRLSLWDPDRLLNRFRRPVGLLWSRWGAMLWLAVVGPALFLVLPHWPELSNNFTDRVLSTDNLIILYLVFPALKAMHELGHATATKAGGGEVHDVGLTLLVLLPIPYVEASASTIFRSKYQRAIVGAAGVMVEMFVAALAFYVWLLAEPGLIRAVLFNVMLIAGVSTLLFNGNPLLRYDAYYVLADMVEIPNLATRSLRYWGYLLERYLLGVTEAEPPEASRSEKAWLAFYGAASSIYRVLVTVMIALFIAGRFFVIGVLLAGWALGAMAVFPLVRAVRHVTGSPRLHRRRLRAMLGGFGAAGAIVGFVLFVPIPSHTHAEGVVWLPEQALVRAGENGFLAEFLVRPGHVVTAGEPLIRLREPGLESQRRVSEARITELEAAYTADSIESRAKGLLAREKLEQERSNLANVTERTAELVVRAGSTGQLVVPQMADMPGRFYRKGDLLGYIIDPATSPLARVIVPQEAVDRVRQRTERIDVRLSDRPDAVVTGRITREVPAGDEYLPSRALAIEGGGEIATDPRDTKGPKTLERTFQFDLELVGVARLKEFGQHISVRFEHPRESLSVQWYRAVRLLFLSRFGV